MVHLPARFDHARNVPAQGVQPEAQAAKLELPQERPGPTALLAAVAVPNLPLGILWEEIDGL
jgi:hypothetical protein